MRGNERSGRRRIGQPTVKCPKCEKLVSPPERLAVHFPRCTGFEKRRPTVIDRESETG
jgi:hypothetical protein